MSNHRLKACRAAKGGVFFIFGRCFVGECWISLMKKFLQKRRFSTLETKFNSEQTVQVSDTTAAQ
jgi:hypothetical protein